MKKILTYIFTKKALVSLIIITCAFVTVSSYLGYFTVTPSAKTEELHLIDINSDRDPFVKKTGKSVSFECNSVEEDLSITFYLANGKRATGYPFEVSIQLIDSDEKPILETDDDEDGIIYIDTIASGDYEVEITKAVGYSTPGKKDVTVAAPVVHKKVDVAEKIVSQNEVNLSQEDGQYDDHSNDTTETIPVIVNTVEFVESSKETIESTEEVPLLDNNGIRIYYYVPVLDNATNKYLTLIDGTVTDLEAVLDENGYLVSGKRTIETEPFYENVKLIDSNYSLLKYDGKTINAEQIAPMTTKTTTTTIYYGWHTIDGKTYYFDKTGTKVTGMQTIQGIDYYFGEEGYISNILGVDVSYWQGTIDWNKVKAQGINFAILRIGFMGWGSGALVADSTFARNISGAKAAGIKVGVYFYDAAITTQEAVEEASMCLEILGGQSLDYPIFIDMEDSGSTARNKDLTTEQRTLICQAFCNTIKNSGYKAGIYASSSYLTSELNMSRLSSNYIWVANWGVTKPYYSGHYDLWQYTQTGVVNGISGVVDMNISYLGY